MFEKSMIAGWGDMDFSAHMRNTAYLDKSADSRMLFFSEHGFPMREFQRLRLGPVVIKGGLEYAREVGLFEESRVTLMLAGLSDDGSRWVMRNEFYRSDGKLAACVVSAGGWLSHSARRLIVPPSELLAALRLLPHTDDFRVHPSGVTGV